VVPLAVRPTTAHTPAVSSLPPPGWYPDPDPQQVGRERLWTGAQWAADTRPTPPDRGPGVGRPPLGDGYGVLAGLVQGFLGLGLLMALARAALALWTVDVVGAWRDGSEPVDTTTATRLDQLTLTASVLDLGLFLVTGILFITWLYRAHRSDRMYPAALRHGSGWAIGGWFVPILGLWRPLQMVNDVRRGAVGIDPGRGGALVGWWWTTYLAVLISGRISAALYPSGAEKPRKLLDALVASAQYDIVDAVLNTVAAALAILVVRHVTALVLPAAADETAAVAPA
jgi:hypothetical protein